jgi:hypothetical protein
MFAQQPGLKLIKGDIRAGFHFCPDIIMERDELGPNMTTLRPSGSLAGSFSSAQRFRYVGDADKQHLRDASDPDARIECGENSIA